MNKFSCISIFLLLVTVHQSMPQNYTYDDEGDATNNCTSTIVCPSDPDWLSVVDNKTACQEHARCDLVLEGLEIVSQISMDTIKLKVFAPSFELIASYTFFVLSKLVYLQMEFGVIEEIQKGAFKTQKDLQILNLSKNKISTIADGSFDGLQRLTTLVLNNNKLSAFERLTFASLSRLEMLDLNDNIITDLVADMFAGLDNLIDLKLDNNRISHMDSAALRPMKNLKVLSLSGNRIQTLPAPVLQQTPKIERLRISHNPIRKITKSTLHPIQDTLEHLYLNDCNLSSIPKKIFNNFPRLSMLVLSNNQLRSLPNLGTTPAMTILELTGNELACDETSPMFRWMRRHRNSSVAVTCVTPDCRFNVTLTSLHPSAECPAVHQDVSTPPAPSDESLVVSTTPPGPTAQKTRTTTRQATTTTQRTTTTIATTTTTTATAPLLVGEWNKDVVFAVFAVGIVAIVALVVFVIWKCRGYPATRSSAVSVDEPAPETNGTTSVDHLKAGDDEVDDDDDDDKVPVEEKAEVKVDVDKLTAVLVIPKVKITNTEDIEVHGGAEQER